MKAVDFCRESCVSRSSLYDWKKRAGAGALENKIPGAKKSRYIVDRYAERDVLRFADKYPGITSYYELGKAAEISESSAGRIMKKRGPLKDVKKESGRKPLHVQWRRLHACWAIDTLSFKTTAGMAYLQMIVEEYSRAVIAWRLQRRKTASDTAEFISRTIELMDAAPLALKFDRGSEFNNDEVSALLGEKNILPLPSPRQYPAFNGKVERGNRIIKKYLKHKGRLNFWTVRRAIGRVVFYMNKVMHRRMFGGRTSEEAFANGVVYRRKDRPRLAGKVKREISKIIARDKSRKDMLDITRKAVVKSVINYGLVLVNHWDTPIEFCRYRWKDILKKYRKTVEASKEPEVINPDFDPIAEMKAKLKHNTKRELMAKIGRRNRN